MNGGETKGGGEEETKQRQFSLVVLGHPGVGKTSITLQFVGNVFQEYCDPTVEDSFRKEIHHKGETIILDVLDTAGQEEFNHLRDSHIHHGEGFLLVYSITSRESLEDVHFFHKRITRIKDCLTFPMIVVGNKSDLEAERVVSYEEGQKIADSFSCPFIETSARIPVNTDEAFLFLTLEVYNKQKKLEEKRMLAAASAASSSSSSSSLSSSLLPPVDEDDDEGDGEEKSSNSKGKKTKSKGKGKKGKDGKDCCLQ